MTSLFYGALIGNNGPSNINKGIVNNLTEQFVYVPKCGKYRELFNGLSKLLHSDAIVISGLSKVGCILAGVAKILRKPVVYIMHGCAEYEWFLNSIQPDKNILAQENFLLKHSNLLLPVSRKFMVWVQNRYPQYAHKTEYLVNGIDPSVTSVIPQKERNGRIVVSGGLSPLKNNWLICETVEAMNGRTMLEIYGNIKNKEVQDGKYSIQMGKVAHEDFLKALSRASVFVLNSRFESFSIATIEALACGCSVLVSEIAGVTDILKLEESDIIHDPLDGEEIRRKLEYLLEHPNNERIWSGFDVNEWSFEKMVKRLEQRCELLIRTGK